MPNHECIIHVHHFIIFEKIISEINKITFMRTFITWMLPKRVFFLIKFQKFLFLLSQYKTSSSSSVTLCIHHFLSHAEKKHPCLKSLNHYLHCARCALKSRVFCFRKKNKSKSVWFETKWLNGREWEIINRQHITESIELSTVKPKTDVFSFFNF